MKHLVAIIVVLAAILSGQAQTGPEASIERPGSRWGPFSLARPAAMSSFTTDRRILVSRFRAEELRRAKARGLLTNAGEAP
jgi:hypothetical protein